MIALINVTIYLVCISYALAAALYFAGAGSAKQNVLRGAFIIAATGSALNLLALILRSNITGRLPLSNGSEFLLSFTWMVVLLYLIMEIRQQLTGAGGFVMLAAFFLMLILVIVMNGQFTETSPLMPALKSPWLTVHVLTAALAYAGFTLAACLAVKQFFKNRSGERNDSIYRIIVGAFTLLSLSIVLGAVWAEQAWGSYWSWDPKETWALITWIIYAVYLHLYKNKNWQGKYACLMVIMGYLLVLFTFLGVNFLLPGLHSYAGVGLNTVCTITCLG